MDYMARHGSRRTRPQELVPGTLRVISVRMATTAPKRARGGARRRPEGYVAR
jgi:epoxyqueuosine reductase